MIAEIAMDALGGAFSRQTAVYCDEAPDTRDG
jgi:hypothetical protein